MLPVRQENADNKELLFPVNTIYCVGQNYAAHAREMGADPKRCSPIFFHKPTDSLLPACDSRGAPRRVNLSYPPQTNELHHEIELVAALKDGGRNIPRAEVKGCIFGYGVGLDMTRRDLQAEARLFLTNDLTELEAMVWKYHARYGYTFKRIGEDLLPAHLFDNSGNAEHKVRRIYLKAQAKAQDFLNTDGSEL